MSHTLGPWLLSDEKADVALVAFDQSKQCEGTVTILSRDISEADARLIAAAPDLLEALKDTLDYWETTGFADCAPDCDCIVEQVRAAIARAEATA